MKYRAKVKLERFEKKSNKWELVSTELLDNSIVDYSHWLSWKNFDNLIGAKTKLIKNGDCMYQYTTIAPGNKEKVVYTRIGAIKCDY